MRITVFLYHKLQLHIAELWGVLFVLTDLIKFNPRLSFPVLPWSTTMVHPRTQSYFSLLAGVAWHEGKVTMETIKLVVSRSGCWEEKTT